jgi:menaquinone-dependent protoporphyrinogen oxidase
VKTLVAYATKRGSTREVAEAVARTLAEQGLEADVRPAAKVKELGAYGAVVLGGALYSWRWHADAREFLARHREALASLPLAVFGMGPRTLDEHDVTQSRQQLVNALARTPELRPVSIAVFGGVVDPAKLHFPFNKLPASDARDWDAIAGWADELAVKLDLFDRLIAAAG